MPSFLLNGRLLARFRDDDTVLVLQLATIAERDVLMQVDPRAFFFTEHYRNYPAVLIRLADVPRPLLVDVVTEAWRHVAALPPAPLPRRFPADVVELLRDGKGLRIRAGTTHRFIGIWVVVVEGRVFVRSWNVTTHGWYRAFLADPRGFIRLGSLTIPVVAVRTRSARLRDAVDRAYVEKYRTPGALKYARDLGSAKSRATTIELRPAAERRVRA